MNAHANRRGIIAAYANAAQASVVTELSQAFAAFRSQHGGEVDAIRADIASLLGHDLSKLKPGSPEAMEIKAKLICSRCRTICETCCEGGPG